MSVTIDDPSFVLICPFSAPLTNRVSDIKRMRTRNNENIVAQIKYEILE